MSRAARWTGRALAAGAALGLGLGPLFTAGAAGQTLAEALASAYAGNPTIQAARAQLRAVNEGVPQALSNWRPQVTVSGSTGTQRTDSQTRTASVDESTNPIELQADVVQPLYRGGRTVAGTERAEFEVESERARLTSIEQQVLLRAATAYMDVLRDQAVVGLNAGNERVLARQLEAAEDRFEVGEVTRTDVAQSETRLAVATAGRVAAEGNLESSRAVFEEVIGVMPGELAVPPAIPDLPESLQETIDLAQAQNPDVVASELAERAAQKRVREVLGELYPTVSLVGTLRHAEETSSSNSESDSAALLAEVVVPLYQQGAVSSRVREAKQVASQRRLEIEETRRRATQEAVSAWNALESARAQHISFQSGVRSAEIALEGVRQENAVGARTILDILDAEQELLDARVNLVRSQRDEFVAGFQVLTAIGRMTAGDLGLDVPLYEPETDYRAVRDTWFDLDAPGVEE
ncbi:MAG TPA: TolC family outer membrane protein [Kiloniellales bacterium]|nr:TolC family outer membrane protein [Kiloniellales bacterium]